MITGRDRDCYDSEDYDMVKFVIYNEMITVRARMSL